MRSKSDDQTRALVCALRERLAADHGPVELCETHISYVLLTSRYAYKIKKPVDLGFVNFSTLALRQHYCDEEVRLNRRLAERLYLGVVSITGSALQPEIEGEGEVVDYAVKMIRFAKSDELGARLETGDVSGSHFRQFAIELSRFHTFSPVAAGERGDASGQSPEIDCMESVSRSVESGIGASSPDQIEEIRVWLERSLRQSSGLFDLRRELGRYRDCHGDLHLGNLVFLEDRIVPFDCIEFNPSLRWIDVASEIAFLFMDLLAHGYAEYAWDFLNQYLAESDDYGILDVLDHHLVYRAMVRAKVLGLANDDSAQINRYVETALACCRRNHCRQIVITHGVSGSGKSWLASRIASRCGAVQIRSDAVRKHRGGVELRGSSRSSMEADIYHPVQTEQVYHELAQRAERVLSTGYCVIVDATFLNPEFRNLLRQTAKNCGAGFSILHATASRNVLSKRMQVRRMDKNEISEADEEVLNRQLSGYTDLSPDEKTMTVEVNTDNFNAGSKLNEVAQQLGLRDSSPGQARAVRSSF